MTGFELFMGRYVAKLPFMVEFDFVLKFSDWMAIGSHLLLIRRDLLTFLVCFLYCFEFGLIYFEFVLRLQQNNSVIICVLPYFL